MSEPESSTILTCHNVDIVPFPKLPSKALTTPELVMITRMPDHSVVTAGWDIPPYRVGALGKARMHAHIPFGATYVVLRLAEDKASFWIGEDREKEQSVPLLYEEQ